MIPKRILLTGGAGFIGSHICEELVARGTRVTVLDDLSSGRKENLPDHPALDFRQGDILRLEESDWPADVDAIIHLAAVVSVADSWTSLQRAHDVNLSATVRLLEQARRRGIRRFVFASSAAVYGNPATLPLTENAPALPLSPYGLQKLASEQYGAMIAREAGMTFVALRFFNVYGPRQLASSPYSGVIARFAEALRGNTPLTVRGDGRQTRDFVYVKDVVQAVWAAAAVELPDSTFVATNIGSGRATTIIELAEMMRTFFPNTSSTTASAPSLCGEIQDSCAAIAQTRKVLGFDPQWPLCEGLADLFSDKQGNHRTAAK